MRTSLYCFAADIVGEGARDVLGQALDAGVDGLTLAAVYHDASDYLPHNGRFRLHYTPAGTAFAPDATLYPSELGPPPLLPVCGGRDLLADLCREADSFGAAVDAWVVYLHRDGRPVGPGVVQNAYGDPYPVTLCPAASITREYAIALTREICAYPVSAIAAEALHYLPTDHGFHHERRFGGLGDLATFLLSLCFCSSCRGAAEAEGIDVVGLAARVRQFIDTTPTSSAPVTGDAVRAIAGEDADGFLRVRAGHAMSLAATCAEIASAAGIVFRFLDPSAALAGWESGATVGPLGVERGWELGIELEAIVGSSHVGVAAYAADPARVSEEVEAFRRVVPAGRLGAILRPMPPDASDVDNLERKIRAVRQAGVTSLGFYHYGMMPSSMLTVLAEANRAAAVSQPTPSQEAM